MKAPMKWLKEFVNISVSAKDYAEAMTMSGSKVEAIDDMGKNIDHVVVGKILSMEKHPDADKLMVCKVDVGQEILQIVTGAPNINAGDVIPLAMVGATLPGGKISTSNLRGVPSMGMMCSMEELQLSKDFMPDAPDYGVYVFADAPVPGTDVKEALGLDTVVEFEITSNRPDCLCILGLARESAATLGESLRLPEINVAEKSAYKTTDKVKLFVADFNDCIRYTARIVENVTVEPSPKWMQRRLAAAGMRPINNIVDITNYVMLELGQPMHAFDFDKIAGGEIHVRRASEGEVFRTLDSQNRLLTSDMLVIADAEKAVALAGVMGGENSEVTKETKTLLLESAVFGGTSIRKTAQKLNLRSEASGRFEKGLDPQNAPLALDRCAQLIEQLGAGTVLKGIADCDGSDPKPKTMLLEPEKINAYLGTNLKFKDMCTILENLDFRVDSETCMIQIPSFRSDIAWMQDLAEEVARFYGYNNITPTLLSGKDSMRGRKTRSQTLQSLVYDTLLGCGLSEAYTLSFTGPKVFDAIRLPQDDILRNAVVVENPLGEDFSLLRTTTLPDMLRVLSLNASHKVPAAWLFEIAHTYHPAGLETLPDEIKTLTVGLYGNNAGYAELKGIVEQVLITLHIDGAVFEPLKDHPSYHPGRTATLLLRSGAGDFVSAGVLGEVHPEVLQRNEVPKRALVAELNLALLLSMADTHRSYRQLPKFPASTRDVSVVVRDDVLMQQAMDCIQKHGGVLLEEVALFDVYKGGQLAKHQKSMAFSLSFRSAERTLTDDEVNEAMENIFSGLEKTIGAELRR